MLPKLFSDNYIKVVNNIYYNTDDSKYYVCTNNNSECISSHATIMSALISKAQYDEINSTRMEVNNMVEGHIMQYAKDILKGH